MECVDDWHREIFRSVSGGFGIQYAIKKKEAMVFRVMLKIRLTDGRIGGVNTSDSEVLANLKTAEVPAAPSQDEMLAAFQKEVTKRVGENSVANEDDRLPQFSNLHITRTRRFTRFYKGFIGCSTNVELEGESATGAKYIISGSYFEGILPPATNRVGNFTFISQADLDKLHRPMLRFLHPSAR